MIVGDVIDSPWGRWVLRRVAPILLQSLERANAYVETDELGPSFTLTGERHEDRVFPDQDGRDLGGEVGARAEQPTPVVLGDVEVPAQLVPDRLPPGAVDWRRDYFAFELSPIPDPAPLTLGAQRPGSVRSSTEQWLPCMTFLAFDEGSVRYLGMHCHFIAPLDDYPLRCPTCVQAQLSSRRRAPTRAFAGHPPGPVAIVCGRALTLGELLADARCRMGFARPVATESPYGWTPKNAAEWREEFNERAAIFEYLGGFARPVAETMAKELIGACP